MAAPKRSKMSIHASGNPERPSSSAPGVHASGTMTPVVYALHPQHEYRDEPWLY